VLKERYFLNAKDAEEDPYETSQIDAVFVNANGIFALFSPSSQLPLNMKTIKLNDSS